MRASTPISQSILSHKENAVTSFFKRVTQKLTYFKSTSSFFLPY